MSVLLFVCLYANVLFVVNCDRPWNGYPGKDAENALANNRNNERVKSSISREAYLESPYHGLPSRRILADNNLPGEDKEESKDLDKLWLVLQEARNNLLAEEDERKNSETVSRPWTVTADRRENEERLNNERSFAQWYKKTSKEINLNVLRQIQEEHANSEIKKKSESNDDEINATREYADAKHLSMNEKEEDKGKREGNRYILKPKEKRRGGSFFLQKDKESELMKDLVKNDYMHRRPWLFGVGDK